MVVDDISGGDHGEVRTGAPAGCEERQGTAARRACGRHRLVAGQHAPAAAGNRQATRSVAAPATAGTEVLADALKALQRVWAFSGGDSRKYLAASCACCWTGSSGTGSWLRARPTTHRGCGPSCSLMAGISLPHRHRRPAREPPPHRARPTCRRVRPSCLGLPPDRPRNDFGTGFPTRRSTAVWSSSARRRPTAAVTARSPRPARRSAPATRPREPRARGRSER